MDEEHESVSEDLQRANEMLAWDDVSGAELNAKKVQKARAEEIEYVEKKSVWRKISRREAKQRRIVGEWLLGDFRPVLNLTKKRFHAFFHRHRLRIQ